MNNLEVKNKEIKSEDKRDFKIFLMCISLGAVGFGLIGILPYEIPLFLRVLIACLLLGIPLLNFKKIIIFGISGGLGYFVKDYTFWDLSDFGWYSYLESPTGVEAILNLLFTGVMIGTFLGIALWNRKAIKIFPLSGAIAFFFGSLLFFLFSLEPLFAGLGAGTVFGAGTYLYLSSIKERRIELRIIAISYLLVILLLIPVSLLILWNLGGGHPPITKTTVSIGEVVERYDTKKQCGMRIVINNYTFLPHDTGKDAKVCVTIQNEGAGCRSPSIYLWYKQDEHPWGTEILTKYPAIRPEIEPNTTSYDHIYLFEDLPSRLRTKDCAVVWRWLHLAEYQRGAEHIIWRLK